MKILFSPINILSSMTRQILVARVLKDRGHEVVFAGEGEYLELVSKEGFPAVPLRNLDIKKFVAKIQSLKLNLFTSIQWILESLKEFDLERMVVDEVALMKELGPDVFVSEERPTAVLACLVAGIPHVSIRNAYRTQYSRYPVADFEESIISKVMKNPLVAQQALLRAAAVPFMAKFNGILKRQGVHERMTYDRYMHSDALVAMCDVPAYAPVDDAPGSFRYVGPLIWRSREPAPDWIDELPKGRRALYISLGSTGTPELFDVLAEQLARRDRPLIITTGYQIDRSAFPDRPGVYIEDMVNAEEVFDRCAAVICHGGNGTVYQALAHGLVCVGIPTHLEQRYNCRRLVDMGLGGHLELDDLKADPAKLVGLVDRLLGDGDVRARLCKLRRELASWDAPALTADCIEELAG